jgi:glucose/arabinose dehydrogenase
MLRTARFALVPALLVAGAAVAGAQDARRCPGDNAGLTLPPGFCATIFADSLPGPRQLVVTPANEVVVALLGRRNGAPGGIVVLRDTDRDGKADARDVLASGFRSAAVAIAHGALYAENGTAILRIPLAKGAVALAGAADTIVRDLPGGGHPYKTFALDSSGGLYVNVGSRTNSCQEKDRQKESAGVDPCVERDTRAGVWRFDARRAGQSQRDGVHYATGIRNAVGITWNPRDKSLWVTQHGRDQLSQNWPALFSDSVSAETPAEELFRVQRGDDFGWPYCYFDRSLGRKVLAPEYGGNGRDTGRCATAKGNVASFPGHWAPNALLFHSGRNLPAKYRDGVFIAFHGSWNRAPLPQQGANVVFQPLRDGRAAGGHELLATGFARAMQPSVQGHRPTGLAEGPDGALYVSDDALGRIWRITWAR